MVKQKKERLVDRKLTLFFGYALGMLSMVLMHSFKEWFGNNLLMAIPPFIGLIIYILFMYKFNKEEVKDEK